MNENGEKINYTVEEDEVAGYETSIDGLTITNSHLNEKISISGTKTWNDKMDGIIHLLILINIVMVMKLIMKLLKMK